MITSPIAALSLMVLVAATPPLADDVPFSSTRHGEVVIPVFIEGKGPYRFLLDTGSSHTAIDHTLATVLGAVPVAKAPLATSVGSIAALVVRLPDVAVGSARVESLLATVLPPDAARWLGDRISGVLGQDFLSQFDYTIDYQKSRLSWIGTDQGIRLALESSHGRFLVSLPQSEHSRCALRLVPDSGTSGLVLFTGTEADRLPFYSGGASMRASTLVGTRTAQPVTVRELRVGSATLRDVPAARVVLTAGTTEDADGLLPLSLFARVSFHHREGYMVVQVR